MCFGEGEIFKLELKNFAGTQAVQQHQGHDGQIAKGAEAFPEIGDLVGGKRNYQAAGLSESQSGRDTAVRPAIAERRSRRIAALKMRPAASPVNSLFRSPSANS